MTHRQTVFGSGGGFGDASPVVVLATGRADAVSYSFWGAFAGTAVMGVVLMLKYPKLPRGVGFAGVLPLLGVAAGQWLATRKV